MHRGLVALLLLSVAVSPAAAQHRLVETFAPGRQYHVSCQTGIKGWLTLPPEKGQAAGKLDVVGKSRIAYDERVLSQKEGRVDRTARYYREMDFKRQVGKEEQQTALRPEVRRLVILRHNQFEVPFAPAGPLLWNEIEVVRTDVFTPALQGLLPTTAVRPGDSWAADRTAVQELTDLESITTGGLTCSFKGVTRLANREFAQVSFKGNVGGVGEDGPARHAIEGYLYFDLKSNHLSYLTVEGSHTLLDPAGKEAGVIKGSFVLTRETEPATKELSDATLQGLVLEPNDENTLILFDLPELGVRFLYPRRWHVAGVNGRQVGLDEKRGNGLLLTVEPLANVPQAALFQAETREVLTKKEKATIYRMEPPRSLAKGLDAFALEAEVARQRVTLQYYLIRQPTGGAVITARLLPGDVATMQRDVERVARSVQLFQPVAAPR